VTLLFATVVLALLFFGRSIGGMCQWFETIIF
jgi:hypothetical protein